MGQNVIALISKNSHALWEREALTDSREFDRSLLMNAPAKGKRRLAGALLSTRAAVGTRRTFRGGGHVALANCILKYPVNNTRHTGKKTLVLQYTIRQVLGRFGLVRAAPREA